MDWEINIHIQNEFWSHCMKIYPNGNKTIIKNPQKFKMAFSDQLSKLVIYCMKNFIGPRNYINWWTIYLLRVTREDTNMNFIIIIILIPSSNSFKEIWKFIIHELTTYLTPMVVYCVPFMSFSTLWQMIFMVVLYFRDRV